MKNLMKKSVASVAAATLLATSAFGASTIVLNGTIGDLTVVGFEDVSASLSGDNLTFVNNLGAFDLGTIQAGGTLNVLTQPIFVLNNNALTVSMALADANLLSGALSNGTDTIAVAYSIKGTAVTVPAGGTASTPVALITGINDGTTTVGNFVATPTASLVGDSPGTYTTTLNVTVTAA